MDLDRIERTIDIDATAERVWDLVSEPGWFVNDGTVTPHELVTEGEVTTVTDPACGTFRIRTVALDEPRYAAYRWLGGTAGAAAEAADAPQSLVEFWIEERTSGVTLRVVESGLEALDTDELERRRRYEDNVAGWEQALAAARTHATS